MAEYQEGQRLQGSDGNVYIVRNGVPVRDGGPQAITGGNPMLPAQIQAAQGHAQAAPFEAPKAQADLTRTEQQISAQPLQNANTSANIQQGIQSAITSKFNRNQGLRQEYSALPLTKNYQTVAQKTSAALRAPDTPAGDLEILYAFATVMDPNSVVRESEQEMAKSTASTIAQLKQQYHMISDGSRLPEGVRPGLLEAMRSNTKTVNDYYRQSRHYYADLAKRNGFDPVEVVGPDLSEPLAKAEINYIRDHGGTPIINGVPEADYSGMVGGPQGDLAKGPYRNEYDPKAAAIMDRAIRAGVPYEQAVAMIPPEFSPPDPKTYAQAVAFAAKHHGATNVEATRAVPTSVGQRLSASPAGAFISGAGKAATLGFGDEAAGAVNAALGGDYTRGRDAFAGNQAVLAAENPTSDLLGQAAGGALTGYGISKGLSKVPFLQGGMFGSKSLLSREAMAGDALYGGGYGAGSDNEDRLGGAAAGLGVGLGGGMAARGVVNTGASALSPTGGKMRPLYDMGVRPSVGQRIGGIANNFEEKLQSIPGVGDLIKGTRDGARDQYQTGLFNDALGQIGQKLPQDMKVGHAPHAFAQDAISNAYDSALSGMTAAADGNLSTDLGAIQRQVATLKPDHQSQFNKIWSDSVARRFNNGQLAGEAYKAAESDLSKRVASLRKNPGDSELADALEQATGALRSSALRNSPPEAVAALDAADAAHARIVRIEDASRKAGEPAEFSPSQYNTAVKTASGGVRNRQYLRGEALNSDIATLGTRLGDKVSNSGTVDRLLAGGAAYGIGSLNPWAAGTLGTVGLANAPGVRNLTTGLMAPRPFFDRAAEQLRQRARLAGMFGAPIALENYGQ